MDKNNCLKEYQNNDCFQAELKYQKGKLHVTYIIIISTIFIIFSIAIIAGGDSLLSGQLSLASTVSSIILSAIAIFMSISGERKTDSIRDQLVETASKLDNTTNDVQKSNEKMLSNLMESIENVRNLHDRIVEIKTSMSSFENSLSATKELVESNFNQDNPTSKGSIESKFQESLYIEFLFKGIRKKLDKDMKIAFDILVQYTTLNSIEKKGTGFYGSEIKDFIYEHTNHGLNDYEYGIMWGLFQAITGLVYGDDSIKELYKISKTIYELNENEIDKENIKNYHQNYSNVPIENER